MCTGNLRSGTELLAVGTLENNGEQRKHGLWYYWIDLVFVAGAAASALLCQVLAERAVWVCAAALLSATFLSGITAGWRRCEPLL